MDRYVIDSSEIIIGRGVIGAGSLELGKPRVVAILAQPTTARLAQRLADDLGDGGIRTGVRVVPDREQAKQLGVAGAVYQWLNEQGFSRDDTLIGIGGGAVTDLTGFVGATYLRGVDVCYVATTLLGAVDASIGGKTGINVGGKNLVGVFRHPRRVLIDLDILDQLPIAVRREGAAEALKAGLIADRDLFELLEAEGLEAPLDEVVERAVAVKVDVVRDDFREAGRRAVLNYGHTIGHAVESATGISHGSAVAVGMVAAGVVSTRLLGFAAAERQLAAIAGLGLPTTVPGADCRALLDLIGLDKKRDRTGDRMVLLAAIGEPRVQAVGKDDLVAGLRGIGVPCIATDQP